MTSRLNKNKSLHPSDNDETQRNGNVTKITIQVEKNNIFMMNILRKVQCVSQHLINPSLMTIKKNIWLGTNLIASVKIEISTFHRCFTKIKRFFRKKALTELTF